MQIITPSLNHGSYVLCLQSLMSSHDVVSFALIPILVYLLSLYDVEEEQITNTGWDENSSRGSAENSQI